MAFSNENGASLLLLVVSILPLFAAQEICHIDIDSSKGLWKDVTPNAQTESDTFCEGYLYRETNLTCLETQCSHKSIVNDTCTLYYNADTISLCLATCKGSCNHGYQCPGGKKTCPCQDQSPRYSKQRMCVPFKKLTNCISDKCNEKGEKIPASCITSCHNGWCDANGGCNCFTGFRKVSNKCTKINCPDRSSQGYCQSVCQNSGCLSHGKCENGECKCNDGFYKDDPNNKIYQCARINCPASSPEGHCQSVCEKSECLSNGKCENGVCKCNDGFYKNDPDNKIYQCAKISCPANDPPGYCQSVCKNSGCLSNGKCLNGECSCNDGFYKNDPDNLIYQCARINCPASGPQGHCQSVCKKSECSPNGKCVNGVCQCNEGFYKNDPDKKNYQCARINCPANDNQGYCQNVCQNSGCLKNGKCVNGECKCNPGYKNYSNHYTCEPIRCPDANESKYCKAACDAKCEHGRCSDDSGACTCEDGFKKTPEELYKCVKIKCPAKDIGDEADCASQCENNCTNGDCDEKGDCKCKDGFKKIGKETYKCEKIKCPAIDIRSDKAYCASQCSKSCTNGECDDTGDCKCEDGFKKPSGELYKCVKTNCPSKDVLDEAFCVSQCKNNCTNGVCDEKGDCKCKDGFKKIGKETYKCEKIKCPAIDIRSDEAYCVSQCSKSCTNGECDYTGDCKCDDDFVWTTHARVDCHHKCNVDGSCSLAAILSGIVGVGFAIIVAIIVTTAILVRARNKKEREQREQEEAQGIPMDTLNEEPEYANYSPNEEPEYANYSQGQEGDMEDNSMYHYQPPRRGVR